MLTSSRAKSTSTAAPTVGWFWDARVHRYRDPTTGRFMTHSQAIAVRDRFTGAVGSQLAAIHGEAFAMLSLYDESPGAFPGMSREDVFQLCANQFFAPSGTPVGGPSAWEKISEFHQGQYVMGRGGLNAMTDRDWQDLRLLLDAQRVYWERFEADVRAGRLSEVQIRVRAQYYVNSGTAFYETGYASSWQITLPAMPADGSTECYSNCRCHWRITQEVNRETNRLRTVAYWVAVDDGGTCADCHDRGIMWAPYVPSDDEWME